MDTQTIDILNKVIDKYDIKGAFKEYSICDNGHINDTYLVKFDEGDGSCEEYIIQKVNGYVFKEPAKIMSNIKAITIHSSLKKNDCDCDIINFLDNKDGKNYTMIDGDCWRVCPYIKNSVTYNFVENSKVLYSAGYAFGRFQCIFSDFPMSKLFDTIPDFHNTKKRLNAFFESVDKDPLGRAKDVREEIDFFKRNNSLASKLVDMQEQGELPLRVTHNDTKYNNILMDKDTYSPLCVIDLDTVMPGLSMYDFGDAIRFAANTAPEDESDLSKVGLNMENYIEFTKGFMTAAKSFLTENEIDNMALGAIVITIELASRFLADHINGDKYFRIHRPNHNLDRARCQIRLAQDMMDKYDKMCRIVKDSVYANI